MCTYRKISGMVHAKLIVVVLRIRILDENIICFKKWFTAYVYGLGSRGNRREYKKRQIKPGVSTETSTE